MLFFDETVKNYNVVYFTIKFSENTMVVKVVINKDKKVVGFSFLPVQKIIYLSPYYVDTTSFVEKDLHFKSGEFTIFRTLTLLRNKENPPLVILVYDKLIFIYVLMYCLTIMELIICFFFI